jgi:hypothetical protein
MGRELSLQTLNDFTCNTRVIGWPGSPHLRAFGPYFSLIRRTSPVIERRIALQIRDPEQAFVNQSLARSRDH